MFDAWLLEGFPWLTALFATTTGILVYREYRRHRRRHPQFPIAAVKLPEFDSRFRCDSVERARQGAVYFLGNPNNQLPATTSDEEAYVLACLSKDVRRIFEFGTCSGRTTYLMALNACSDAQITTLTLPPDDPSMQLHSEMNAHDVSHAVSESHFDQFVYSETEVAHKVKQLFQDSAALDVEPYRGKMDLIFIDGGHSYAYIKSDTEKALQMIAPGGCIVWHDYRGLRCRETRGVFRYLNELHRDLPLQRLGGTSLIAYRVPEDAAPKQAPLHGSQQAA